MKIKNVSQDDERLNMPVWYRSRLRRNPEVPAIPPDVEERLIEVLYRHRAAVGLGIYDELARKAGSVRPQESYAVARSEALRIRIYRSRIDRAAVVAAISVSLGVTVLWLSGRVPDAALSATGLCMLSVCAAFLVLQSGRTGYLARTTCNYIDDLASSMAVGIVRGHHRVHQVEQELVARAELSGTRRLMVVDLWSGTRAAPRSGEFARLQTSIDRFSRRLPERCETAYFMSPENEELYRKLALVGRQGSIRKFSANPLQCDALLTDDEVILSFPRAHSNRSFALRFRNQAVVEELWASFEVQVGRKSEVPFLEEER